MAASSRKQFEVRATNLAANVSVQFLKSYTPDTEGQSKNNFFFNLQGTKHIK
jgi:hypothetical protein